MATVMIGNILEEFLPRGLGMSLLVLTHSLQAVLRRTLTLQRRHPTDSLRSPPALVQDLVLFRFQGAYQVPAKIGEKPLLISTLHRFIFIF